ncbi:MmcQ/YjbR family DNA-binding protein [Aeromicrobium sp.]|uniref:MmcQ/YjbR family DNA-binding protein n=1 Tax=Aeromicrobium sp. TaxID=1871063 RepID=UPI002FC804AC
MTDVVPEFLDRVRAICMALPEAYEEPAWIGVRWRIRKRTFAHVVTVDDDSTSVFKEAFALEGEATAVTFRVLGDELLALREHGHPFYYAGWGRDVMGMHLDDSTDWDELGELLTDSYCVLAPKKLVVRARWGWAD